MPAASDAIQPHELDALFACLGDLRPAEGVALAVSGGGDSTALMVLFADWLRQHGRDASAHVVLTVDHRLRPESAARGARRSPRTPRALGFRHATLAWEATKPHSGVQAAARAARYRLMSEHARAHGLARLLTAHTLDDQAETLLMRLARGSGLDGLTAMAPANALWGACAWCVRCWTCRSRGSWQPCDSARSPGSRTRATSRPVYERTRLRAARATLDALGLTAEMLGTSVRRLQRARAALDSRDGKLLRRADPAGIVQTEPVGILAIDRERLRRAPEEIVIRLLDRCIAAAGGSDEPVPLASLEPIVGSLRRSDGGGQLDARPRPDFRPLPIASASSASRAACRCRVSPWGPVQRCFGMGASWSVRCRFRGQRGGACARAGGHRRAAASRPRCPPCARVSARAVLLAGPAPARRAAGSATGLKPASRGHFRPRLRACATTRKASLPPGTRVEFDRFC